MSESEYLFKICVIGSPSKPKTSLIRRYAENKFDKNYMPTLGVDITTKKITINNNNIKLILVDTAGQEFFGKLCPSYYRGANACLIVFGLDDKKSFESVPDWITEFRKYIPSENVPIMLLGIKNYPQKTQKVPKLSETKIFVKQKLKLNPILPFILKTRSNFRLKKMQHHKPEKKVSEKISFSSKEAYSYACLYRMDYCEIDFKNSSSFQILENCMIQLTNKFLQSHR